MDARRAWMRCLHGISWTSLAYPHHVIPSLYISSSYLSSSLSFLPRLVLSLCYYERYTVFLPFLIEGEPFVRDVEARDGDWGSEAEHKTKSPGDKRRRTTWTLGKRIRGRRGYG